MKVSQISLCASLFLLLNIGAQAQGHRVMMNVNYSVNVPTGNFSDYIGKTSFRGWNASITYRINEKIAIGATTGFQDFYEKTARAMYKDAEGSDISAVVTNSIQTIPLLATVHYSLSAGQSIQPYVGLGVGGNLIMHSRYLGQFATDNNKLGLAARPIAGVFIPVKKDSESGVNISGAFNFMPYKEDGLKNVNSWGINIGAKFPLR
jgi:opacity protein-like surface antigen